jgi:hypothetical protein
MVNYAYGRRDARRREFPILAQDPDVRGPTGEPLVAKVLIPNARIDPGPRTHRVELIDYDTSTPTLADPIALAEPLPVPPAEQLATDRAFHAQNAFVIVSRTLDTFESALGRRLPWSFGGHQLYVVPHAMHEANAFYSEDDRAVLLGYADTPDGRVFTCLSHDIIAHETTHAILDGLRDRYDTPGLPDQRAFHEAFADIVALLSTFSLPEVVDHLLGPADPQGQITAADVSRERLEQTFGTLAEQLGRSAYGRSRDGLRNSLILMRTVRAAWQDDPSFEEAHKRGEVLVAAVMNSMISMWQRRLEALRIQDRLNRGRTAEEGAKTADHLLRMCMRAIDYCPPLEFEFADFLDAVLVSDQEMEPDDKHGYRDSLKASFAELGIQLSPQRIEDFTKPGADGSPQMFMYDGFNYVLLRSDPDEVFGFLWENHRLLDLDLSLYTHVDSVRSAVRFGSDGFLVTDVLATYVQEIDGPCGEVAARLGIDLGAAVDPTVEVKLYGGGVVIFDQFGRVRFHVSKPIGDGDRQRRRLEYLDRIGRTDQHGRFGFSDGASKGQSWAQFHLAETQPAQAW